MNIASKELGISYIEVEFRAQEFFKTKDNNAIFISELYTIIFSDDWLQKAQEMEVLKCAFHETRHAYQKACIDFPELITPDISKDIIEVWEKEFYDYLDPRFDGYFEQEIEKDAIKFSDIMVIKVLNSI